MTKKTFKRIHFILFIVVLIITLATFCVFFRFVSIPSTSMVPAYQVDDVLIVRKTQNVKQGDVVVFYNTVDGERYIYIKRCMGLVGDTIGVHNGVLWRNGEPLEEPYLNEPYINGDFTDVIVPEDMMFVMGDNRNVSLDSRYFGFVPVKDIIGKPCFKF